MDIVDKNDMEIDHILERWKRETLLASSSISTKDLIICLLLQPRIWSLYIVCFSNFSYVYLYGKLEKQAIYRLHILGYRSKHMIRSFVLIDDDANRVSLFHLSKM
jgi:hypothetical protein